LYIFKRNDRIQLSVLGKYLQWDNRNRGKERRYDVHFVREDVRRGVETSMEENEISTVGMLTILVAIQEVARINGETKTQEFIDKLIESVRCVG
jgi:hypothetical protein